MASSLPESHPNTNPNSPTWDELGLDAWDRVESTLRRWMRGALESMQPKFLAEIGFTPSRVIPDIREHIDFRRFPAQKHLKEILRLEREGEQDGTYELAVSAFVKHLLDVDAPKGTVPHFIDSLLKANNYGENLNPGAWRTHDALIMACVYLPVQNALSSFATKQKNGDDFVRKVASHMSVQGRFITCQNLTEVFQLLDMEASPNSAIVLLMSYLYARQVEAAWREDEAWWNGEDSGHFSDDLSGSDRSDLEEEWTPGSEIMSGSDMTQEQRPCITSEPGVISEPNISSEPDVTPEPKIICGADVVSEAGIFSEADFISERNVISEPDVRQADKPSIDLSSALANLQLSEKKDIGLGLPAEAQWLSERRPIWLDTLLDLAELYGHRHIRNKIPEHVLSSETWKAVCDKFSFRQCPPEPWESDDGSSDSGESVTSDVTIVQNDSSTTDDVSEARRTPPSPGEARPPPPPGEARPPPPPRPRSMQKRKKKRRRNRGHRGGNRERRRMALNIKFGEEITSNLVEVFHDERLTTIFSDSELQWDRRGWRRSNAPSVTSTQDRDETSSTSTEENALVRDQLVAANTAETSQDIITSLISELTSDEIILRPYQQKLLKAAREGKNVMIVLPTGTGKTYIVLKYVQEFLSKTPRGRVMFMAPKIKLAEQQYHRFEHYFPTRTYFRCGRSRSSTAPFSELLYTHQVFVMTPQCLVEAIEANEVEITDFSLLVFDECHHAIHRHPYKVLMDIYMDAMFAAHKKPSQLPQIIGLTASPGVGEGGTLGAALTHMKNLCSNMNVEEICTVEDEEQLQNYVKQPKHEIHTCKKRAKDGFRTIIEGLMETIEDRMISCSYVENHEDRDHLKANLKAPEYYRTYTRYTHWVGRLGSYLVKIADDKEAYSQFFASSEMLRKYHQALILNEDCESQYALTYLKNHISQMEKDGFLGETDRQMVAEFNRQLPNLERAVLDASDYNPKLSMLENILGQIVEKHQEDTSCMVFVRTLELSRAIQQWIQRHPDLMQLNPGRITGSGRSIHEGGMSRNAAANVMADFNMGKHKAVVCTSAAEEGLDFQACAAVIRYDYVTNMISMIQTRGRARRPDSQYFIMGDETRGNAEREMKHMAAEKLMNQAVLAFQELMNSNPNQFRTEVRQLQQQERARRLAARDIKGQLDASRTVELAGAKYNLYCRGCQRFACMSTDIRLYAKTTRMVLYGDFNQRWRKGPGGHRQDQVFQNLRIVGKLHCNGHGCTMDWGCLAKFLPTERDFPIIKLDSFILEDARTKRKVPKKLVWKEAPFLQPRISADELANF